MNDKLCKEVTQSEIKAAVDSLGVLKALGVDGSNGLFYQYHWDVIDKEVCAVVKELFNSRELFEDINETQVVLIPKILRAE